MSELVVFSVLLAALFVSVLRGPRTAFGWVYLPTVILAPVAIGIEFSGIPDFSVRRAALVGLVLGALLTSRSAQLIPRWRGFDLLPMAAVISFSISFGLTTSVKGFASQFASLTIDWFLPYVLARASLENSRHVRAVLPPLVISFALLAFLAVYEARMGFRLGAEIWHRLAGTEVPAYFYDAGGAGGFGRRWGYLRACATRVHPIVLGTFFATAAPLVILWGQLRRGSRLPVLASALACAAGCVASLSRGPMLVLLASSSVFTLIAYRIRSLGILIALVLALASPFAVETVSETIQRVDQDVVEATTDSALYRIVLLLIYTDKDFGLWGNPGIAGAEFENTWSIDNAYLYFFIVGGWCGGLLFVAMVVTCFVLGLRNATKARGRKRKILSTTLASFGCMTGCMGNIWFSPDYWPLFFLVSALVVNQSRSVWFAAEVTPKAPRVRRSSRGRAPHRRGTGSDTDGAESARPSRGSQPLAQLTGRNPTFSKIDHR